MEVQWHHTHMWVFTVLYWKFLSASCIVSTTWYLLVLSDPRQQTDALIGIKPLFKNKFLQLQGKHNTESLYVWNNVECKLAAVKRLIQFIVTYIVVNVGACVYQEWNQLSFKALAKWTLKTENLALLASPFSKTLHALSLIQLRWYMYALTSVLPGLTCKRAII